MTLGVYSSANTHQAQVPGTPPEKTSGSKGEGTKPGAGTARDDRSKQSETSGAGARTGGAADTGARSQENLAGRFQDEVNGARADYAATGNAAAPSAPDGKPGQEPAAAGSTTNAAAPERASAEQAAAQRQMFSSFVADLDPATQQRLSTWLPDALNGGAGALKEAANGLTPEQAADLNALAEKMGTEGGAIGTEASAQEAAASNGAAALYKAAKAAASNVKANLQPLQQIQQRFGEHAIKEATPGLAPTASYDVETSLQATKDKVYEEFVSDVDPAIRQSLDTWLPDALADRSKLPKDPNAEQGKGLHAIAVAHGFGDADALQRSVVEAYDRAVAVETAAELPTVVDMMLVRHDGEYSRDVAFDLNVAGDDIAARVKLYEDRGFGALDSWLPDALAGKGSIPTDDPEAMALLGKFAEDMGMAGGATATPEAAFDFIEQTDVFDKALHAGETGDSAFLLFSDKFLDNVIAYGEKHGAVNDDIKADAARTAEMLLGPDDGSGAARPFDAQALMAAMLHRTDQSLSRPQELQAASGYINKAETLTQQKERLADTLVALHSRDEVGIGPMTPRTWAEAFSEISPEIVGKLNERAFNSPTGEKMQIITQHLGVPGDHEFMIDERRKIQISNDEMGNVTSFDQDKKKKGTFKKILDVAIPVVATVLTFTPLSAVGVAMNLAYSAYKGAEAIKEGDWLGGALAIAGAIPGGGTLGTVAKGARIASAGLQTYRAAENGDYLGALTSGLGGVAMAGGGQAFSSAATTINVGRSIDEGDYLAAASGAASIAGDVAEATGSSSQYALRGTEHSLGLADAIDDKNYAGIGGAVKGLYDTGNGYLEHREEQTKLKALEAEKAEQEQNAGSNLDVNSATIRGLTVEGDPGISGQGGEPSNIEIVAGDTLSQIAQRHGVSVDDLMAANPQITDPDRIFAGQQLTLPQGIQSVGAEQQDRLREVDQVQGRPAVPLSPPRPNQGDPALQPGATHPNADDPMAIEDVRRDFDQAIDAELSSIDERIAKIDEELAEGINHAPVEHLRRDEQLKLMAYRRDLETLADDPDAALNALTTDSSDTSFASHVGKLLENTHELNKIYENVFDALQSGGKGQAYDAVGQALAEAMKEGTTTHLDAGGQAQRVLQDNHRIAVPLHELQQTALEARQMLNENQHPSLVEWMTNYTVAVHTGQLNGAPSQQDLIDIMSGNKIFPFRPGGALDNGQLPGTNNLFDFDPTRSGANLDPLFGAGSSTDPDANLVSDPDLGSNAGSSPNDDLVPGGGLDDTTLPSSE